MIATDESLCRVAEKDETAFFDTTTTTTMNNTTALRILVVDDSKNHRDAATTLLEGHNLTIASSYDEARDLLVPKVDYEKLNRLRKEKPAGGFFHESPEELRQKQQEHDMKLVEEATTRPNFDVVLLDLMMPASRSAQGGPGMDFVGKEMPVGTFLILLALNAGVKNIGMVTDTNHHHHPASAALDPINSKVIKVGETRIFATNYPRTQYFDSETGKLIDYGYFNCEEGRSKYPQDGYEGDGYKYKGAYSGKGWNTILRTLLEGGDECLGA